MDTIVRRAYTRLAAQAAVVLTCLGLVIGLAVHESGQRADESQRARVAVCQEIELLKAAQREAAWESFNSLSRSLKILNIPKTPEITQLARESRDAKLERFARSCALLEVK